MGSAQSLMSSEAALTAIVVAGAVGIGYQKMNATAETAKGSPTSASGGTEGGGKKDKKKKKGEKSGHIPVEPPSTTVPTVVPLPTVIPGGFETPGTHEDAPADSKPKKAKNKKKKGKAATPTASTTNTTTNSQVIPPPAAPKSEPSVEPSQRKAKRNQQPPSASSQLNRPLQSSISIDTDGSWTRVESGRRSRGAASASEGPSAEVTSSDAGITTPVTGNSSPIAERTEDEGLLYTSRNSPENRRTLAERMLPKPRKTGVDDMLETPDYPTLSRVMRVQPMPDEKPASGFSWGDYEDVQVGESAGGGNDADGEDDGWGVVKGKGRPKIDRAAASQPQSQKAPEALTKRQRQNANKREAQKALKAEVEVERLSTLARHQRELEKAKMIEQFGKGGGNKTSGGMKATVDERGKLVWE
ncbi:hypothetical protein BDZ94DRAFT_349434 [Collybia nuda]|uniref:Uncharacterized protein n=1 Tax=Collybia nuda TaxID=64659 RepID=A0A9P5YAY4_9AGAR|nr:hypothetical protein BDZ94DRAFT_349434 [Collybia nuda]